MGVRTQFETFASSSTYGDRKGTMFRRLLKIEFGENPDDMSGVRV